MADKHRPEHSDCVGIETLRKKVLGIFSDVAEANRPEVIVTAGQNGAKEESGHSTKGTAAM